MIQVLLAGRLGGPKAVAIDPLTDLAQVDVREELSGLMPSHQGNRILDMIQ